MAPPLPVVGLTANLGIPTACAWIYARLTQLFGLYLCCANFVGLIAAQAPAASDLFQQGQALVGQGRLAEAELALDKAAQLLPDDPQTLTLLGEVKGRLGEFPAAIGIFRHVIELNPQSASAHVNLAIALSDSGDFQEALGEAANALAIDPNLASAHLNRARILDDLKREPEAEVEFATARRLAPDDPDVYFYGSFVERALGHFDKETLLLRRLIALQPSNEKALILLAKSLTAQSKNADAETALRSALAIDPNSAEATYMLSRALAKSDPTESRRLAEQFAALRKRNAALDRSKTIGNEAYGAYAAQDWPRAIRLYREALQVCGNCGAEEALRRNLGLTLCKGGDIDEGGKELQRALALNPDDREVVKALSLISQ